jgi:hypothetical protein
MTRYRLSVAAVAVAAAVAVGLGGCGGSTTSNPSSAKPPASPTTAPASTTAPAAQPSAAQASGTQVITYHPWSSDGTLASGITAASTLSGGSCQSGSEVTDAPDAFRCYVGNTIYDPAFSDGSSSAGEVAFPNWENPDSVTVIKLASALPAANPASSSIDPWMLLLANGQRCTASDGASGPDVDGLNQSYGCSTGSVYGLPDRSSATWTIHYTSAPGASATSLTQVDVTTAYE